ncbi:hypothetical protein ACFPRL_16470 [Pseudoclavibacter helvolus]
MVNGVRCGASARIERMRHSGWEATPAGQTMTVSFSVTAAAAWSSDS